MQEIVLGDKHVILAGEINGITGTNIGMFKYWQWKDLSICWILTMDEIINLVNIEYDRNLLTMEEIIKFGELFETMGDEMSWGWNVIY